MTTNFSQLFGNIRTPEDYRRAKEEFELNKQLKRGQLDVQRAKIEQAQAEAANPTSNLPATLQVNAAIESALKKGDYDTANRIAWLTRSQAYGVDTFGPQGNTPETFQPFKPKAPVETQPVAQSEYVPTGQSIMPSGGSIAQQLAAKGALEAGAKERSKLQQQLAISPNIKEREAYASKTGAERAAREQKNIDEIRENQKIAPVIDDLRELNRISPSIPYAGMTQWARRMTPGTSPEEAAVDLMKQKRLQMAAPLAKQLGVNPTDKDFQATLDSIFDIEASKESRALQIEALADRIDRRQAQLMGQEAPQKSGARREMEALQGKFKKSGGRLVYNPATGEFE